MPQLANITVKAADGTTNVVFTALTGASGDGAQAVFRNDSFGPVLASRPTFMIAAMPNGTRKARRIRFNGHWPITAQDAGGNLVVTGSAPVEASFLIPQNLPESVVNEISAQFPALIASGLARECIRTGFAPR